MMTHNSSQSRILAVWLVLLAFLCGMIVPSMALAKQEMVIATEGDPGDGLESTGGGSGAVIVDGSNSDFQRPNIYSTDLIGEYFSPIHLFIGLITFEPIYFGPSMNNLIFQNWNSKGVVIENP